MSQKSSTAPDGAIPLLCDIHFDDIFDVHQPANAPVL